MRHNKPIKRAALLFSASALALALSACGGNGQLPETHDSLILFDPVPLNPAASAVVPFPFDGFFAGFSAPTLNIPNASNASFVSAANQLDGFSTSASLFADILGPVDYTTVPSHILIVNSRTGARLTPGVDFTVHNSAATSPDPITGISTPISTQRSRLLIDLLRPLAPSTTYLVGITSGIVSPAGGGVITTDIFRILSSATPIDQQTAPILAGTTATQRAQFEALRSQQIRPAVVGLIATTGVAQNDLVLAWSFTTQSIDNTLRRVAANTQPGVIQVANTGLTTSAIGGLGLADIYAGVTTSDYYLGASGGDVHSTVPLTTFWRADPAQPNLAGSFLGLVPCPAFAAGAIVNGITLRPSTSTTACFPELDASTRTTQTIPTLVTLPHGLTRPTNGWPVVIFQHGITRNRTDMLAVADGLARAGFAVVAIDLPLHGLTDPTSPFYRNQLFAGSPAAGLVTGERTFDLDLQNNATGASGPDGLIDPSGSYSINLTSLLTSRDNIRQAVTDLLKLVQTVKTLDFNNDGTPDIDPTQIRYFGHSLGGIVGTPLLAVSPDIGAAVLANPGGGVAKLLDGSRSFGARISAGLAAAGVVEGTDTYETFLRFAQTTIDAGDPINYGAAARAAHPLVVFEVANDLVVPNAVAAGAVSNTQDLVTEPGRLSGTDPLVAAMGLTSVGPITPPLRDPDIRLGANQGFVVRFAQGEHGSVLDPTNFPAVTQEMQSEAAQFLASGGLCLPVGGLCPVAP
jgi:pimeloyl-ACP methyl ester carboxylesterase